MTANIANADRIVQYAPNNTTGPFPVPFPVFDPTGADLEVTLNGGVVAGWTFVGTLDPGFYGAPNTWVNGSLSFDEPISGTLFIEGNRAPRRESQYAEGRGIPARDHNTEYNTLTAICREVWQRLKRAVRVPVGEAGLTLPPIADRAGKYLGFDGAGNPVPLQPNQINTPDLSDGVVTDPKVFDPPSPSHPDAVRASKLSFLQAGTDAVYRTVQDKLRERFSVKDFGAVGDGATDDTAALHAAITAAGVGAEIYFPPGVYRLSDHDADGIGLMQLSGQRWVGAGRRASVLLLDGATTDIKIVVKTEDFAEDYSFEDLTIDGNRAKIIPAVDLYNHFFAVVGARGGKRGLYRNISIINNWGRGLQTSDEMAAEYAEDILVDGVWCLNNGTKAISATKSKRVTIEGCFVEVNAYTSADHPGGIGNGNASSGSCFEFNDAHGAIVANSHGVQVGETVRGPGIRFINSSRNCRAFGNYIEGAFYLGFIQNSNDCEFFSNTGKDLTGTGIFIGDVDDGEGTCLGSRVHDNKIIDPAAAYVQIIAAKASSDPEVEAYIYNNDFIQEAGSPTHGIYNSGVVPPATGGSCTVYEWGNRFRGTIPHRRAGPAAAEIQPQPDRGWQVIAQSAVAVSHTGDTSEAVLANIIVPANRMGKNGRLRVTAHWSCSNSANNKITRVRFGGSQAAAVTNTTVAQQKMQIEIANRNSLSSQIVSIPGSSAGVGQTATSVTTLSIGTDADRSVALTAELANSGETVTLQSYVVELFYQV
ncbi:glycosyl hydrolase family 28-related protein [Chelatococcus sp. XZ-Ab1]|uniref:glycosyl hydrolase family 28-related protein n=1 Tax=Chelatococcus sp. XZ-Ab1 TaxID=3034027 RepID=UPI0023E3EDD8|nr:glycosyl hydrolase family 28-related protein [Chelatococcus sp. XZ-Ab1]